MNGTADGSLPLVSERLLFRRPTLHDLEDVLAYRSGPEYRRFQEEIFDADMGRNFLQRFIDWTLEEPQTRFPFAVIGRGDPRVIGICSVRKHDPAAGTAEFGFELAPDQWGRGLATEIARTMLRFGFEVLGLQEMEAHCLAENEASRNVLQKVGMRLLGEVREEHPLRGSFVGELRFGIREAEWRQRARLPGDADD